MNNENNRDKKLSLKLPLVTDLHTTKPTGREIKMGEKLLDLTELFDRGLPFIFTLLFLPLLLLSGCGAKEQEQKVNLVTLPELAALETSETTALETLELEPLAVMEETKEEIPYDPEEPQIFLKEYLIANGQSTEILEDLEFIKALKGLDKDDVIYYARTLLKIMAEQPADEEPSEGAVAEVAADSPEPANQLSGQADNTSDSAQVEDNGGQAAEVAPEATPIVTTTEVTVEQTTTVATTSETTQPTQQANPPQGATAVAQSIITLSNSARQENGLGALSYDARLESIAAIRVQEIVNLFSHTRPDGSDATQMGLDQGLMRTGENIAKYSTPTTGDAIYQGFMNSPGHRANILNSEFTHFAVVAVEVNGMCFVVMYFGRP